MTADGARGSVATTSWGGAGLIAVGVLRVLTFVVPAVPVTETIVIPLNGLPQSFLIGVLLLASTVVLAVGLRGETGIVGTSRAGAVALVVFGAVDVVFVLVGLAQQAGVRIVPSILVGTAYQVVPLVAIVVAAVVVLRAGVLTGIARWALVPVAVVEVMFTALQAVPLAELVPVLELLGGVVLPALLAVAGAACIRQSRAAERRTQPELVSEQRG